MLAVHPLPGIGEIAPGDDLAALLGEAAARAGLAPLGGQDVLVVTQKIVSKAENRWRDLGDVAPGAEAVRLAEVTRKDARFVQAVLDEAQEVVRAAPNVLIVRHRLGFVMANAGLDRSNAGAVTPDHVLLLPADPDASAARLHEALGAAVIVSDSFGRPWRIGVTGVAIGAAGLPALLDKIGDLDRQGRPLEMTQVALADLLASAATLVMGEAAEGIPAVLIRGYAWTAPAVPAAALVRPLAEDLFR